MSTAAPAEKSKPAARPVPPKGGSGTAPPQAAKPAAPAPSVADRLAARVGEQEREALAAWRAGVFAAAEGRELTAAEEAKLDVSYFRLRLTVKNFHDDVSAVRAVTAAVAAAAKLPTAAEHAKRIQDTRDRVKRLDEQLDELKKERAQVEFRYANLSSTDIEGPRRKPDELRRQHPRLYDVAPVAVVPTAQPPAPPAGTFHPLSREPMELPKHDSPPLVGFTTGACFIPDLSRPPA